jgi:hypothetical protein
MVTPEHKEELRKIIVNLAADHAKYQDRDVDMTPHADLTEEEGESLQKVNKIVHDLAEKLREAGKDSDKLVEITETFLESAPLADITITDSVLGTMKIELVAVLERLLATQSPNTGEYDLSQERYGKVMSGDNLEALKIVRKSMQQLGNKLSQESPRKAGEIIEEHFQTNPKVLEEIDLRKKQDAGEQVDAPAPHPNFTVAHVHEVKVGEQGHMEIPAVLERVLEELRNNENSKTIKERHASGEVKVEKLRGGAQYLIGHVRHDLDKALEIMAEITGHDLDSYKDIDDEKEKPSAGIRGIISSVVSQLFNKTFGGGREV